MRVPTPYSVRYRQGPSCSCPVTAVTGILLLAGLQCGLELLKAVALAEGVEVFIGGQVSGIGEAGGEGFFCSHSLDHLLGLAAQDAIPQPFVP